MVELRDQTDIRQCHFRTSKKSCGTSHRLKSCKPRLDPVTCPCIDGFLVQPDLLPKMFEHPQIVDWMDITGDDMGHASYLGTLACVFGEQVRDGMDTIKTFTNRQRQAKTGSSVEE